MSWEEWFNRWCKTWKQGQHATMIGPTSCGKTTIGTELVKARTGYVMALGTKPVDETLSKLLKEGWIRVEKWPPPAGKDRVVLWPKMKDPRGYTKLQAERFHAAFDGLYQQGKWCVWLDELYYMSNSLNMKRRLQVMYTHARSLKISLLGTTQRPAWVPLEAYNQAGHLIMWRTGDENDLRKLGSINGVSGKMVADIVGQLDRFEFLHVDLIKQTLSVSKLDMKARKG